jgi:outer membrane protein OmpA-like peptidoglycan-associated protein
MMRSAFAVIVLSMSPAYADETDPADLAFWQSIQNSTNPAEFKAYLDAFPNGRFVPLARIRAGATPSQQPTEAVATTVDAPVKYADGTRFVFAVKQTDLGDYECIASTIPESPKSIRWSSSCTMWPTNQKYTRRYAADDLRSGNVSDFWFGKAIPEFRPGATGPGISSDQLRVLKSGGSADGEMFVEQRGPFPGHFQRIESQDVPVKVLVNDQEVSLPAIHVRGIFSEVSGEFWFLDNPNAPVVLRNDYVNNDFHHSLNLVKIYTPGGAAPRITQGLVSQGRIELHGIYFDFDKATLRPESQSVLADIADVLRKNPSWHLTVAGHTDNIGSDSHNMALSTDRANSVVQELTHQFGIASSRLVATGYGASQPIASNDTLEGRASNRRVELVRSN